MILEAVIEVTSYDVAALDLLAYIKIPDGYKAITLPCTTPDGLPNHVQVLVVKGDRTLRKPAVALQ